MEASLAPQPYFSGSPIGGGQAGKQEGTGRRQADSDASSLLSSVKLTDDYTSVESLSLQHKPSQIARIANAFSFGQYDDALATDERAGLDEEIKQNKKEKMMGELGRELVVKVLGITDKHYDRARFRTLKDRIAKGFNPLKRKFTIDYIMRTFDVEKLKLLRTKFLEKQKECEDGYELIEFVGLMKNVIPYDHPSEEYDLVHGLCNLFSEIDINGNGGLEWDEFTGFLIEAVDQK